MQIDEAEFGPFTRADNDTGAVATASLTAVGVVAGDCGSDYAFTAVLTGTDGSEYSFDIDADDFFSVDGQAFTQDIARTEENYTFTVTVEATGAQSVAEH